ncbi:MAG: hypothetical protein ACRC8S_12595 [Fimbriiglobus sp.]
MRYGNLGFVEEEVVGRGFVEYSLPSSGGHEFVAYSAFLDYRFADGSTLTVEQQPAWCPACRRFVLAERIPEMAELEDRLAAVRSSHSERRRLLTALGQSPAGEAKELIRRIGWRQGRVSPPRCLECGTAGVHTLPASKEFAHPATGEPVMLVSSGFASMERWVAGFTPEGQARQNFQSGSQPIEKTCG